MLLMLCYICPPLACFCCGRFVAGFFCCFLCLFFYFPGAAYAVNVVNNRYADKRTKRVVKAINLPQWKANEQKNDRRLAKVKPPAEVSPYLNSRTTGLNGTIFRHRS